MALSPRDELMLKTEVLVLGIDHIYRVFDRIRWIAARENARNLYRRWRRIRHINFLSYGSE